MGQQAIIRTMKIFSSLQMEPRFSLKQHFF